MPPPQDGAPSWKSTCSGGWRDSMGQHAETEEATTVGRVGGPDGGMPQMKIERRHRGKPPGPNPNESRQNRPRPMPAAGRDSPIARRWAIDLHRAVEGTVTSYSGLVPMPQAPGSTIFPAAPVYQMDRG